MSAIPAPQPLPFIIGGSGYTLAEADCPHGYIYVGIGVAAGTAPPLA